MSESKDVPPNALLVLHALTFLHPGTGQTTGVVDLPVQRERHTGFPMIASSGLKGSLRDKAEQKWPKTEDPATGKKSDHPIVADIFGSSDAGRDDASAGALAVSDARILAFPVRSLQKVFVWITCSMALKRLKRDVELAGLNNSLQVPEVQDVQRGRALLPSQLTAPLVLEEINLQANTSAQTAIALNSLSSELDESRLVIVSDDDFQYFVRHATQISARIHLNDRKTTSGDGGNLWYEETLPPETVMYALLMANKPRNRKSNIQDAPGVLSKVRQWK